MLRESWVLHCRRVHRCHKSNQFYHKSGRLERLVCWLWIFSTERSSFWCNWVCSIWAAEEVIQGHPDRSQRPKFLRNISHRYSLLLFSKLPLFPQTFSLSATVWLKRDMLACDLMIFPLELVSPNTFSLKQVLLEQTILFSCLLRNYFLYILDVALRNCDISQLNGATLLQRVAAYVWNILKNPLDSHNETWALLLKPKPYALFSPGWYLLILYCLAVGSMWRFTICV